MDIKSIASSPNDNGNGDNDTRKRGSTTENVAITNETNNNNGEIASSTIHKKSKIDHNNNSSNNNNNNDDTTPNKNDDDEPKAIVTPDQTTTKTAIPITNNNTKKKSHNNNDETKKKTIVTPDETKQKTPPPPPKTKKRKKKHIAPATLETRRALQLCCKDDDLHRAMSIYDDAVSNNVEIEAQSFYNLLSLCDGCPNRQRNGRVHVGTPRGSSSSKMKTNGEETRDCKKSKNGGEETSSSSSSLPPPPESKDSSSSPPTTTPVPLPQRRSFAFALQSHMSRLSLPLNETSYTALLRLLCLHRTPAAEEDLTKSEKLLLDGEGDANVNLKLRSYASLLTARASRNELDKVMALWKRMESKGISLSEAEYATIAKCARMVGDEGVIRLVLTRLSEMVLVPSGKMVKEMELWFESDDASQNKGGGGGGGERFAARSNVMSGGVVVEPMGVRHVLGHVTSPGGYTISRGCRVDGEGVLREGCMMGRRLRPVMVEEGDWEDIGKMNDAIVMEGQLKNDRSKFQGGGKGLKRPPSQSHTLRRQNDWTKFKSFLSSTTYDAVMDAANVGYYKQNFLNAPKHVDYRQIDAIYRHFLNQKKKMLIILHERHFHPSLMPSWAKPIASTWEADGMLYKAPGGSNDDWYWLQAALEKRCMVVTNDEMRDHHFMMLSQSKFLRWKERHQVHFHFEGWEGKRRVVDLKFPDVYSRRIQAVRVVDGGEEGDDDDDDAHGGGGCCGLVVPLCMKGDEGRFMDGDFRVDEGPEEETYLCICPTKLLKK